MFENQSSELTRLKAEGMREGAGWLARWRGAELILCPKFENGGDALRVQKERKLKSERDKDLSKYSKTAGMRSGFKKGC